MTRRCCLIFNSFDGPVGFVMPQVTDAQKWVRLIDTNLETQDEVDTIAVGAKYLVTGRSLLLFVREE